MEQREKDRIVECSLSSTPYKRRTGDRRMLTEVIDIVQVRKMKKKILVVPGLKARRHMMIATLRVGEHRKSPHSGFRCCSLHGGHVIQG